ncbi:MAG: TPM domain-containing protein [Undibacterium sp.]|nr:TPM domain-containing protein [Undibacterium sp.]
MTAAQIARAGMLALTLSGSALAEVAVPPLSGHITDQTATLNAEQKGALELTLQSFESKKGSQIAVLIVPGTAPETIEQYSLRVAEQWKLGRKKIDDGAILVVAKNDRTLRIEVGYGLEGPLNDAISKRIISETITPRFTQGDFYGGISAGVDQIIRVVDGEALPAATPRPIAEFSRFEQYAPALFILAMVLGGVLRAVLGRFPGALVTGGAVAVIAWLFAGALSIALVAGIIALLITLLSGSARSIGALGAGSGRGGFGSGGGFSGGGGGFGGGGASGRW